MLKAALSVTALPWQLFQEQWLLVDALMVVVVPLERATSI